MNDESLITVRAAALGHVVMGTVLLALGDMFFVNLNEDPQIFIVFSVAFAAPGLYLVVTGAVARGMELARR